jgi:hypothetical protein
MGALKLYTQVMAGQAKAKVRISSREEEIVTMHHSPVISDEPVENATPDLGQQNAAPNEVEIVRHAADVLGANQVPAWMRSQIPSLGGATPYSLMRSPDGRRRVETVLLKIEHGVY